MPGMKPPKPAPIQARCAPSASAQAECRVRISFEQALRDALGVDIDFNAFREEELSRVPDPSPPSPFDLAVEAWRNENA